MRHTPTTVPGSRRLSNLAGAATFATGASVLVGHSFFLRWGFAAWPTLLVGLALVAGSFALVRPRPRLGAVVATQGMVAALVVNRAAFVVFGQSAFDLPPGYGPSFAALLGIIAISFGYPLFAPDRTRSVFAPHVFRRALLVGAVANVAAAVLYGIMAAHALRDVGHAGVFALGLVYGFVALLQAISAFGVLRMRGIALVIGLAATALGAVVAATSYSVVLIAPLVCSLLAMVAYAAPLVRARSTTAMAPRVRVASPAARPREEVEDEPDEEVATPSAASEGARHRRSR